MIDLGDPVTLYLTVVDPATGAPADATAVTGTVTLPDLTTIARWLLVIAVLAILVGLWTQPRPRPPRSL